MLKKLFKPITVGGATGILVVTSFISYAIGLLRDKIIAFHFGTSDLTDTYNASFLIPDALFNLFIAGALAAAFMPVFSEYLLKDKKEAFKVANTMLNSAILVIGLLSIISFIFMDQIISLSFSEATPAMQQDIINMTRMMLFSSVVFTISNTIGNVLMSYKHFLSYSLSPILYNAGIILGTIFLQDSIGIYSAAVGVLIGGIIHCLIRVVDLLFTDYKYKFEIEWKHPGFIEILKLMWPRALSLLCWQVNLYIYSVVGIRLMEGGLAAFNYARNIQSFAVSLFGISLATAIFPYLTSSASNKEMDVFTDKVQKTVQRILFFTIPSTVGLMMLSEPIIQLILGGGEFDDNSVRLTSLILFFFSLSIPFESLSHILSRAFYALKDTKTPMYINLVSMAIMAFCTIYLAPKYGIEWFPIGFTIGFFFFIFMCVILLARKLKDFKTKVFLTSIFKMLIANLVMAAVIQLSFNFQNYFPEKLFYLLQMIAGAASYFITAILLKCSEVSNISYVINRVLKRPTDNEKL
ncbi:MAG: murein biosynthesis integral membrane protein MurJ [Patescibacteria group bacterium]